MTFILQHKIMMILDWFGLNLTKDLFSLYVSEIEGTEQCRLTKLIWMNFPYDLEVESIFREASFKISVAQVKTYSKDNIILCGDAAHTHSPVGGRGMNLGINDAFAAVRAIMENDLDKYNSAQHKKGEEILRFTEAARRRITSNSTLNNLMLKFIIGILSKSERLQRIFAKRMTTFEWMNK